MGKDTRSKPYGLGCGGVAALMMVLMSRQQVGTLVGLGVLSYAGCKCSCSAGLCREGFRERQIWGYKNEILIGK